VVVLYSFVLPTIFGFLSVTERIIVVCFLTIVFVIIKLS